MKATELMIGDWVKIQGYDGLRITAINKSYVNFDKRWAGAKLGEINPIPLTPEILEKNGFELQRDKSELGTLDTYWLGSELGTFRIHKLNNGDYQFGLAKIKYVHQLQHAIRLCGIDKEIEI